MLNETYELVPSEEGLALFRAIVPDADFYLRVAHTGTHHLNPYHNLTHELATCYWAYSCYVNSHSDSRSVPLTSDISTEARVILIASLFHDHNHSGGRLTDDQNVKRAQHFVHYTIGQERVTSDMGGFGFSTLKDAISCTRFVDGRFPEEPTSLEAKCLRDADLMSIYSNEGRHLLLGLLQELGWTRDTLADVAIIMERQTKFLTEAKMYTSFGTFMKDHYLKDALDAFAYLLRSQLKTDSRPWPTPGLIMTNAGAKMMADAASAASNPQDGK